MGNQTVTHSGKSDKGQSRHPLTSGAYFDAKHENTHTPNPNISEYTSQSAMRLIHPAQKRRILHDKPAKISVYADMVKVSYPDYANGRVERDKSHTGGGIRGNIAGFSRASRKRMLEFMARVRDKASMLFLTMTYPDDYPPDDPEAWHADFEAFRHRFERAYPTYRALWRMELVERKSGENMGFIAPHYHMIIYTEGVYDETITAIICDDFWAWCSNNWFEIANYDAEEHLFHGVHCTMVRSRKHALAYVSKYIGKEQDDGIEAGRRWGRIGRFDTSPSETVMLSNDEAIEFRRLVKKWLVNRKSGFSKRISRLAIGAGYSVFGLGDALTDGAVVTINSGAGRLIWHAQEISLDKKRCERGVGD